MTYPSLGKVVSYTWATKPNPVLNSGTEIFITDIGVVGSKWKSNGTIYVPLTPIVLSRLTTPITTSTGTAEEVLAVSSKIPSGVLAIGRRFQFEAYLLKSGTSESTASLLKIGTNSNGVTGATTISSSHPLSTTNRTLSITGGNIVITNTTIQQTVIGGSVFSTGASTSTAGSTPRTITDVSSNDLYISLTCTKTTGSIETLTCQHFEIILYP